MIDNIYDDDDNMFNNIIIYKLIKDGLIGVETVVNYCKCKCITITEITRRK